MRRNTPKRTITPDPKYKSVVIARLINKVMRDGKKETARKIVYDALDQLAEQTHQPALEAAETSLKNVSPLVEVKSKRIGGATYQVPSEVRPERKLALSIIWIIAAARNRKGAAMNKKLATELLDAYNNTGAAIKKREDTHKMAESNKAFAHFARF